MSGPQSRIPSPAQSSRRRKSRTLSVGSAASNTSVRLAAAIPQLLSVSPLPKRQSVLNDDTDIEMPARISWWKRLDRNSRDVTEIIEERRNENVINVQNVVELLDVEILSQEKENLSLDLPESSDGESIHSIVIPKRKLFVKQDNRPQKKFPEIVINKETFAKEQKSYFEKDNDIDVRPKQLFSQAPKPKTKPIYTAALLNISQNKTVNKAVEKSNPEVNRQVRNLFGNKPNTKKKNMYEECIVTDNDDEIPEIESEVFGFQIRTEQRYKKSLPSQCLARPSTSNMTDIEMEDWQHLPSSTMMESDSAEEAAAETLSKRIRLSSSLNPRESGIGASKLMNKFNLSNMSPKSSSISNPIKHTEAKERIASKTHDNIEMNVTTTAAQILNESKNSRVNISGNNIPLRKVSATKSLKILQDKAVDKTLTQENMQEDVEQVIKIANEESQNTLEHFRHVHNEDNDENFTLVYENDDYKLSENIANKDSYKVQNVNVSQKEADKHSQTTNHDALQRTEKQNANIETHFDVDQNKSEQNKTNNQEGKQKKPSEEQNKKAIENNILQEMDPPKVGDIDNEGNDQRSVIETNILQMELTKEGDNKSKLNDQNNKIPDKENCDENYEVYPMGAERNVNEKMIYEDYHGQALERGKGEQINHHGNESDEILELNDDGKTYSKEKEESYTGARKGEDQNDQEQSDDDEESPVIDQEKENIDQAKNEINEQKQLIDQSEDEESKHEYLMEQDEIGQSDQEDEDSDTENEDQEANESIDNNEVQEDNESDNVNIASDDEIQRESDSEQNESEVENEIIEQEEQSENDEQNSSAIEQNESNQDELDEDMDIDEIENHENETEEQDKEMDSDRVSDNEVEEDEEYENIDSEEQSQNHTHDTTGRNRRKDASVTKSPEAVLHDKTNRNESFKPNARNTSIKSKTVITHLNIKPSLAPARESVGFSDGTVNSSAEGSVWDSHRTTRKTLRQTFGKDFTPRKSLRTLVMERAAKRQTNLNEAVANKSKRQTYFNDVVSETLKMPLANSTEFPQFESYDEPDPVEVDETVEESDHEASRLMRQATLETYLLKVKQENAERRLKIQEQVMNSLKRPAKTMFNTFKMPEIPKSDRRATKTINKPSKTTKFMSSLISKEMLPPEFLDDLKYKPPKRFRGKNAPWITKRLYKYLEDKLRLKYDYRARVRAERLVEKLYQFVVEVRRKRHAPPESISALQLEMARLGIVQTYYDFYGFFHEYMPREIRIKVNPDILNDLPKPKSVFSDIIREEINDDDIDDQTNYHHRANHQDIYRNSLI